MLGRRDPGNGARVAYGPRQPIRSSLRRFLLRLILGIQRRSSPGAASFLEFAPPPRDARETADLAARVNWYLPAAARTVPIVAPHPTGESIFSPHDAPYMDPALVADPGWIENRPDGKSHRVIHRFTLRTALGLLRSPSDTTVVDANLAYGIEEAYFELHRAVCRTRPPTDAESAARLLARRKPGGRVFVLATGPSAKLVDPSTLDHDIRITCNSAVKNHELIAALQPDVIAFGDPVFHYGPSRYAATFRADLMQALELCDALLLTTQFFVEPLLAHVPSVRDRLAVIRLGEGDSWWWPVEGASTARRTGNVLTNLMLPAAFALGDEIDVAGSDGRQTGERYFWKHNTATQYTDDLMESAFEAHPAFFRDRDYRDYYDQHCQQLEELISVAERTGKIVHGATASYIPALRTRGAPAP